MPPWIRLSLLPVALTLAVACGPTTIALNDCVRKDDEPDDAFADTNCDGIDGNESKAIFVALAGNDANPGSRTEPMATLQAALGRAVLQGKSQVLVSEGTYAGPVVLVNGVGIYGGYSRSNAWTRGDQYVVTVKTTLSLSGRVTGIEGRGLTTRTVIDRLTVEAGDAPAGASSVAMYCTSCTAAVVKNCVLKAGAGGDGADGDPGAPGEKGIVGGEGGSGNCDIGTTGGAGGSGGFSPCGRTGGTGGKGGDEGAHAGDKGGDGAGGTAGGPGGAGGDPGKPGTTGTEGTAGSPGSPGAAGTGGALVSGFYIGTAGGDGTAGGNGDGGGGGGGGGGQGGLSRPGPGNGGGGGGGGGCGGGGGLGGGAGGSSFGLFVAGSNGFILQNTRVTSGKGGKGGAGGTGGAGGAGASGGLGKQICTSQVGAGGDGGKGGGGAIGGAGGGGTGGLSWALFRVDTTINSSQNTFAFGTPGAGGRSGGNPGQDGSAGIDCSF